MRIRSIEFSNELLFTMVNNYPRIVKANSEATFDIRFIPHIVGPIEITCTITTNIGVLEYQVGLPNLIDIQITGKGVRNAYGILPLLDEHIPRGGEYLHSVVLYNPSKDKKIVIHRVGGSDDLDIFISAATEIGTFSGIPRILDWVVDERRSTEIFSFSYKKSDQSRFFVSMDKSRHC